MYKIDFKAPAHVHFIGIGGVSMSGLALLLADRGFTVSGSDWHSSDYTDKLEEAGVKVSFGQKASNITQDIDVVVYTAAVHADNEEFIATKNLGIPMLTRAELLGQIMDKFNDSIAVAGTHGKTTTTSMISEILMAADVDPTISNGGILNSINTNTLIGHSQYFLAEACEYTNSFWEFFPRISVVLNIEEDHLDFFKDIEDIRASFLHFMNNTKEGGFTVINCAIDRVSELTSKLHTPFATFAVEGDACLIDGSSGKKECGADFVARNITYDKLGHATYDLFVRGEKVTSITLAVPGRHNVANSLAAIAVADFFKLPMDAVKKGLSICTGSKRRFEKKGEFGDGIVVVDDYAHHPTEITATLQAAKACSFDRVVCVFQPHTYTRTKALFHDFVEALKLADVTVLAPIYAARETDTLGVSSEMISEELQKCGKTSYYFSTFEEIEKFLQKKCMHGDLLITMGAGNVVEIGDELVK